MNKFYLFFAFLLTSNLLIAQTFEEVSIGAGYANTTFYNLSDGAQTTISHVEWDIAFGGAAQGASVFVNEAAASSSSETQLFLTSSTDFAEVDTAGMERILNEENTWEAGAFNHVADATNPFDYGWGTYSTDTHTISGTRVFAKKLRDDSYKKLKIQSLASGTYTFRYANLDGTNEVTQTVAKADFTDKTLAYYSFADEAVLDLEPANWDLMFTRYYTVLNDGTSQVDYIVTGFLSNKGVKVARAEGVDPETVDATIYENDYSEQLNIVGHDWKGFDLETFSWVIPEDLVYFVKTQESELYQVQFIDFTGSSEGTATLGKTFLGITSVENIDNTSSQEVNVFPNPTSDFLNITFNTNTSASNSKVLIFNTLGQIIKTEDFATTTGENTFNLSLDLPQGTYTVLLQNGKTAFSKIIFVK